MTLSRKNSKLPKSFRGKTNRLDREIISAPVIYICFPPQQPEKCKLALCVFDRLSKKSCFNQILDYTKFCAQQQPPKTKKNVTQTRNRYRF